MMTADNHNASVPTADDIHGQLDRLRHSAVFSGSSRLWDFLHFVAGESLAGRGAALREATVGNAVYGRDPPYDPRIDSTVRVEARRLRRKLHDYYEGEGRDDPVLITLPAGGYVPAFSFCRDRDGIFAPGPIFEAGKGAAVAVMPLRALSGDAEFADGLTDEIIHALSYSRGLRVVSRSVAFQYKDRPFAVPDLARDLAVDAVLQGTVRQGSGWIRVTVELCGPQGFVLWSDRFDAVPGDTLLVQEHIATTLSSRVRLDSSAMRAQRIGPGPDALEANAAIYRARQLLDRQTPDSLSQALEIFTQVSMQASDYARGFSGIADCHCDMFRLGLLDRMAALAAVGPAVDRALAIDPQSVEALTALAARRAWLDWDRQGAEETFRHAMALGGTARTARLHAVHLTYQGQHDDAARLFHAARVMEPISIQQDIAETISHYQARRFDRLAALPLAVSSPEMLVYLALARLFADDADAARSALAAFPPSLADIPHLALARAELSIRLGLAAPSPDPSRASWFARATWAAANDDGDTCLDALGHAMDGGELPVVWIRTDPRFDSVRPLPAFQSLLDRGLKSH